MESTQGNGSSVGGAHAEPAQQRQPPLYVEFNPWLGFRTVTFDIREGDLAGTFESVRPDYVLNLLIGGSQFKKESGFFLATRYVRMDFNRQVSDVAGEGNIDQGTSIRGFFFYAVPSYVFRLAPEADFFLGWGPSWVRVTGNVKLCCAEPGPGGVFRERKINIDRLVFPTVYAGWRFGYFLLYFSKADFTEGARTFSAFDGGGFLTLSVTVPLAP